LVSTFAELQAQLAGDAAEIRLAPGTYPVASTIEIRRDVSLVADGGEDVLDGQNARRVISISSGNVHLSGLSITKGRASVSFLAIEPTWIQPCHRVDG